MILPDKEFLRIEEIAARWRKATGMPVRDADIFEYIRQGVLPAYIYHKKKYYLVPESELTSFDEYLRDRSVGHVRFSECSFVPTTTSMFDGADNVDVIISDQRIYVKQKDLAVYEENAGSKEIEPSHVDGRRDKLTDKPLGAVERKSLHLIIVALVELAELNGEPDYTIASNIISKANKLTKNTVVNHLRAAYESKRKQEEASNR